MSQKEAQAQTFNPMYRAYVIRQFVGPGEGQSEADFMNSASQAPDKVVAGMLKRPEAEGLATQDEFLEELNKQQVVPEQQPVVTVVNETRKTKKEVSKPITAERVGDIIVRPVEEIQPSNDGTTILGRVIAAVMQTGAVVTDPEVRNAVIEMVREAMEAKVTAIRDKNDATKWTNFKNTGARAWGILSQDLGIKGTSFKDFLVAGLRQYEKDSELEPGSIDADSPQGVMVLMDEVYLPLVSRLLSISAEASEQADKIYGLAINDNEAALEQAKESRDSDLRVLQEQTGKRLELEKIATRVAIAERISQEEEVLAKGEEADVVIRSIKLRKVGTYLAEISRGLATIPLATLRGAGEYLRKWAEKDPVMASAGVVAVVEFGVTGLILKVLPLSEAAAIGGIIFVGGAFAQGVITRIRNGADDEN